MIGASLAHYRVTAMLGSGGMGEVWLAEDTRLGRPVALKILPAELALDSSRQARFEAEAKTASTINHPNITHIYEVGEADGVRFIAMEYVEGADLTEAVRRAPLTTPEIARIGVQLADALADAHDAGVVHRDIKPANLMLTPRGHLKVLDFGLAKLRPELDGPLDEDALTQSMTQPGLVVGTVRYMSPEQTLGRVVDARSDIFSAGIVLYELATGRAPFLGATSTETIVKITRDQPAPVRELNAEVPVELERIIRKCLEKDPDRRYQNARDLMLDLEALAKDAESGSLTAPPPPLPRATRSRWLVIGAVVVALAAVGLWLAVGPARDRGERIASPRSPCCRSRTPPTTRTPTTCATASPTP